jgi:large subunit ribosomal protein L7/L12
MAKLTNAEIIESLKEKTLLELNELVDLMKEEFGVDPTAVAAGPAAAVEEEPSEVTVTLTSTGAKKIGVIKVVRQITGLGLKEAKALVDGIPSAVKEDIEPEEAEEIKNQLEEAGATVEVK